MLTCLNPWPSTYTALHVCYDILPLLSTTCAHACLFIASTQPGLLLRLEDWWWVLGVRATSQLPVEFHFEDPLLVARSDVTLLRLSVM
jgi:hypothetical protein